MYFYIKKSYLTFLVGMKVDMTFMEDRYIVFINSLKSVHVV